MKKIILFFGLGIVISLSACSFEAYQCPAYPSTVKSTKHGAKAQARYIRKHKL